MAPKAETMDKDFKPRFIHPGDNEKTVSVELSLAQLKSLQAIVHEHIENYRKNGEEVLSTNKLFEMLEYHITGLEP